MSTLQPLMQFAPVQRTLANGLTVLLEPLPYLRSATAGIWIKTGSARETEAQAGISHFLEHLFFKGTTTRTARQLMEAIESRGGHLNAFTSRDYTCIYAKSLGEHIGNAVEILADILRNSQFFDFDKEKNVVLEEIATIEDVPEDFVHDVFYARLWPEHPLGRPIAGTEESVSATTLEDVRTYYRSWYEPSSMILSVSGSFDEDELLALIEREFSGMAAAEPPRDTTPAHSRPALELIDREIAQHHLCFGFPAPKATDEKRYVYSMLSSVLGGGSTSRLFDRIREEAGLAYSIYSFHSTYDVAGVLGVYAAVAPENLEQAVNLSTAEIVKLRNELIPAEELALNREQLKGGLLMSLESTYSRMSRMAKSYIYFGRVTPVEEIVAAVEAVTEEDIRQAAHEVFHPERCTFVSLGPTEGIKLETLAL
ncbi:MAG: putative zinc protease [Candidatus Hydrogenedentota bacterium]